MQELPHFDAANFDLDRWGMKYPFVALTIQKQI